MTAAYECNGQSVSADAFYAIACDPRRSVAVEACAGAGKTWMLVSRIVRALLDGAALQEQADGSLREAVRAHEILAITFTRKAAGEMRERLDDWLKEFTHADDLDMGNVIGRPAILKLRTSAPGDTPTYKWFAVVAGGVKQALVSAHLVDMGHGESCSTGAKRWSSGVRSLETPLNSVLASSIPSALVAAFFEQANGGFYDGDGRPADAPISTITAAGSNQRLVTAYLVKYYGSGGQWQALHEPMHTCRRKPEWAWCKPCRFRLTSLPRNTSPAPSSAPCCSMSTFQSTSRVRRTWFWSANGFWSI